MGAGCAVRITLVHKRCRLCSTHYTCTQRVQAVQYALHLYTTGVGCAVRNTLVHNGCRLCSMHYTCTQQVQAVQYALHLYTPSNKNPLAWYFVCPDQAVTCGTVAIVIRVVLPSPYLCIRGVSLSSIHYNQSHRVYINRRQRYICLIWN